MKRILNFKNYFIDAGTYLLASLIPMVLSLIANPSFAKNLSPTDYATIGYYTSFSRLLTPFIVFYMLHYYQKRYFELSDNGRVELKALIFKLLLTFSFVLFVVAIVALFAYTHFFVDNNSLPFFPYGILTILPIFLSGILSLELIDLKMQRKSAVFFRLSLVSAILSLLCSVILVVFLKMGALGKMLGAIIGPLALFVWLLVKYHSYLKVNIGIGDFRKITLFCLPLVAACMLEFFASGYDRVFLEQLVPIETLGYYSVGVSIAAYLGIFSTAISTTFGPDVYSAIADRNFRKCAKVVAVQVILISIIVTVFILLAPYLVDILTAGRYVESTPYVRIIALSSITASLCYALDQVTIGLGYTKMALINKIVGTVICVASFSLLITAYGAIGAAWGLVLSFAYYFLGNGILLLINYKFRNV